MKFVQPIRDTHKLQLLKQYLKERNERDYVLLMVGINTGLRISDILPLQVGDVRGPYIEVVQKKTRKRKRIKINRSLREALDHYIRGKPDSAYLFAGRSKKHKTGKVNEPISSSMAYKVLNGAAQELSIAEIGTHSLRKTFGYHFYQREKDIALLMELFDHSDESITLRYLGIKQDTLDDAFDRFQL
ncbi:tyrosine-type recombinase/integrase [Paenibacillus chibensis]|uniref:Tyrosine-type recombinase/integrase n=1 Tax=Paenibacillus chibensis TaxID=59846 RepID=A0ABU6PV70_9BACL|nr:tyrosine-type recombinase/integrase [Paenibacillus chibensis]